MYDIKDADRMEIRKYELRMVLLMDGLTRVGASKNEILRELPLRSILETSDLSDVRSGRFNLNKKTKKKLNASMCNIVNNYLK